MEAMAKLLEERARLGPAALLPAKANLWSQRKGAKGGALEQLEEERDHLITELAAEAKGASKKVDAGSAEFAAEVGCTPSVAGDVDRLYADLEREHAERVAVLDRSFGELLGKRDAFVAGLFDKMDAAVEAAEKLGDTASALGRPEFALVDGSVKSGLEVRATAKRAVAAEVRGLLLAWYSPQPTAPFNPFTQLQLGLSEDTGLPTPSMAEPKLSHVKLAPAVRSRVTALVAAFLADQRKAPGPDDGFIPGPDDGGPSCGGWAPILGRP